MTVPIVTAIVLTLNEVRHLPDCLASLRALTPSVIVFDSGSTDGTQRIAIEAEARLETRTFDGYASQRNAAFELVCDTEWVLFLDADERLTERGAAEIVERIGRAEGDVAGMRFPRRNLFFGRQVMGGGWWPDYQTRLFRVGRARFDETHQVHEVAILDGRAEQLDEPLIHINYETRREFVQKQREYTRQRVRLSGSVGRPRRRAYVSAPAREFHRRFVAERGYRDGVTGLFLATVLALEEIRACWLLRRNVA